MIPGMSSMVFGKKLSKSMKSNSDLPTHRAANFGTLQASNMQQARGSGGKVVADLQDIASQ